MTTRRLYFIDGPLCGQSVAIPMHPDWDGRFYCDTLAEPHPAVGKFNPTTEVKPIKTLKVVYRIVDDGSNHMKVENIS